jgi:hypothetical protein
MRYLADLRRRYVFGTEAEADVTGGDAAEEWKSREEPEK